MFAGKRAEVELAMRAVSIVREERRPTFMKDLPEHLLCVRAEWQDLLERHGGELGVRDLILKSICPEVHGMYIVKLAIALAVCSNVGQVTATANDSTDVRGSSHLLLIGDPGLAKSRLLKFASTIAMRSVHTTGMGCSAAGLTAAVIKEDGEWQLEAGALVLADGGICCLDEFNLMRDTEKTSILEAMEQQTVSMAKAGLVCKLSTRCAVLAATNPKSVGSMSITDGLSAANIGIASPLLSRFDVVFILRDERNADWDSQIADHVLKRTKNVAEPHSGDLWSVDKLQSHFLAIRDIDAQMTREANAILAAYYQYCRADHLRDVSRTTVRLFDSLVRLAQAHARLVFRSEVTRIDAIAVVQLMESSWGFGRLVRPFNIIKQDLPLGPTDNDVKDLLTKLQLSKLLEMESSKASDRVQLKRLRNKENVNDVNVATVFVRPSSSVDTSSSGYAAENMDVLDEILCLDVDRPLKKRIAVQQKPRDAVPTNVVDEAQTTPMHNIDAGMKSAETNSKTYFEQFIFQKKINTKRVSQENMQAQSPDIFSIDSNRNITTQTTVSNDRFTSQLSRDRNSQQPAVSIVGQCSQSIVDRFSIVLESQSNRNFNTQTTVSNDRYSSQLSSERNSQRSAVSTVSQCSQITVDQASIVSESDGESQASINLQGSQRKGFIFDSDRSEDDMDVLNSSIGSFIVTQSSSGESDRSRQSKTYISTQASTNSIFAAKSATKYSQSQSSVKPQRKSKAKFVLDSDSDEDLNINSILRAQSSVSAKSAQSQRSNVASNQSVRIETVDTNRLQKKCFTFDSNTEDEHPNIKEAYKVSNSKQPDERPADNDSAYDTLVNTSESSESRYRAGSFITKGVDLSCLDFD